MEFNDNLLKEGMEDYLFPPVKPEESNGYTNIECNLSINIESHDNFDLSKTERLGNLLKAMNGDVSTNNNKVWLFFKYRKNHIYKHNLLSLLCFISKIILKANGFAIVKMFNGNGMIEKRTPIFIDYMTYGCEVDTLKFLNSLYKVNL